MPPELTGARAALAANLMPYTLTTAAGATSACGLRTETLQGGVAAVDESGRTRYRLTLPGDTAVTLAEGSEVTVDAFPGRRFRVQGPARASNLRLTVAYAVTEDR